MLVSSFPLMQCPMCEHRISAWAGVRSPSPMHIRCNGCRTVLRVRMRGLVTFLALAGLMLATIVGYAAWHVMEHANYMSFVWILLALLVLCALEFGTSWLYARYASLEARQPSPPRSSGP